MKLCAQTAIAGLTVGRRVGRVTATVRLPDAQDVAVGAGAAWAVGAGRGRPSPPPVPIAQTDASFDRASGSLWLGGHDATIVRVVAR